MSSGTCHRRRFRSSENSDWAANCPPPPPGPPPASWPARCPGCVLHSDGSNGGGVCAARPRTRRARPGDLTSRRPGTPGSPASATRSRNRNADQTGLGLNPGDLSGPSTCQGFEGGDLLLACGGPGSGWTLESGGNCGGVPGAGVGDNIGPGGGQF
ncbi:MAG: hypothetical protein J2P26_01370 [Nocardiopsaceae bacterium]|nr:hypothetical protein [Nocardiopsaceae bacterium]